MYARFARLGALHYTGATGLCLLTFAALAKAMLLHRSARLSKKLIARAFARSASKNWSVGACSCSCSAELSSESEHSLVRKTSAYSRFARVRIGRLGP